MLFQQLDALTCETRKAWETEDRLCIQTVNQKMLDIFDELQIQRELDKLWDNDCIKSPTMKMVKNYLDMVMSMLSFTRSVRSADWNLRLSALENFTEYFFAMD